jgi:hypothetical protein
MGDSGKSAVGPLKTINFSYPTPRDLLLGTPTTLPTTEPASAQVGYTVQNSDLTTITPTPISVKWVAGIITAGKCVTSGVISWRALKNGVSIATGSTASITANNFYTETHWRWYDIQVGDLLEVKLWSSVSDSNYDYQALYIYPTQLVNSPINTIMKDVTYMTVIPPSVPSGNGNATNTAGLNILPTSSSNTSAYNISFTGTTNTFPALGQTTHGFFRMNSGDVNLTTYHQVHATLRPQYQKNYVPSSITYREVLR